MVSLEDKTRKFFKEIEMFTDAICELKYLGYIESANEIVPKIFSLQKEVVRLQDELSKCKGECNSFQMKLKNAKIMLDDEKSARKDMENEKYELERQISIVRELLGRGNVNETLEKLHILSSTMTAGNSITDSCRLSLKDVMSPNQLSTINEDTNGTVFTVSDIDMTEGDELEVSTTRSGRQYRRSSPRHKRRSSISPERQSKKSMDEIGNINKVSSKAPLQEITNNISYPSAPIMSPEEFKLRQENNLFSSPQFESPMKFRHQSSVKISVNTPGGGLYSSPSHSPHYSSSRINNRPHTFVSKSIYWTDHCQPCGKRILFGKIAHKCRDCKSTCHAECEHLVPLPCIPIIASTPGNKAGGTIADFAPRLPPMVPAIVVHCTNEIENRGLSEVGIYRVPGSERDVKELKERFLRGKEMPVLAKYDIHVICGAVKDFLRNLKEPLVTYTLWGDFVSAAEETDQQHFRDGQASLYQAISDLPQPNRDTLAWCICHLQRVSECADCKMPASNLAKVFGPTIVRYSSNDVSNHKIYEETIKQQKVMEKLLAIPTDYWKKFITVPELPPMEKFRTPDKARRRRSLLTIVTPNSKNLSETPRRYNSRK